MQCITKNFYSLKIIFKRISFAINGYSSQDPSSFNMLFPVFIYLLGWSHFLIIIHNIKTSKFIIYVAMNFNFLFIQYHTFLCLCEFFTFNQIFISIFQNIVQHIILYKNWFDKIVELCRKTGGKLNACFLTSPTEQHKLIFWGDKSCYFDKIITHFRTRAKASSWQTWLSQHILKDKVLPLCAIWLKNNTWKYI